MAERPPVDRNRDTDRMWAYHERTKHSEESLRRSPHHLDWDNQPNPFRSYEGAPRIALEPQPDFPEIGLFEAVRRAAGGWKPADGVRVGRETIGRLLYYSLAISAWKRVRRTDHYYSLRVNPSSGNLHPTDSYLLVGRCHDLAAGVYHYHVPDHALELRREGDVLNRLSAACRDQRVGAADLVVVLTSVFWRESWKYRDRAYRYCHHDAGHAAAGVLIAAAGLGLSGYLVGHFVDSEVAELIGAAQTDEHPLLLIPLFGAPVAGDERGGRYQPAAPAALLGRPNRLSAEEVPYPLIDGMQASTRLRPDAGSCPAWDSAGSEGRTETPGAECPEPRPDPALARIVRQRRSAIDFDASFSTDARSFHTLLACGGADFPADFRGNLRGGRGRDLIRLFVYLHRVNGLSPGVYRYDRHSATLTCLRSGDARREAAYLSLGQVLAGHAVAAFSMIADLGAAARVFGNRGYRYAHFEAGFIGQRLYLAAEALGFNATGIGAFFDDDVHRFLGLTPQTGQVIYHFAVGRSLPDDRIVTVVAPPQLVR